MGRKQIDLTGKRYGKLVVLRKDEERSTSKKKYWFCQCDCGNIKSFSVAQLRSQGVKSCGCLVQEHLKKLNSSRAFDLTGQKFGYLTVLRKDEERTDKQNRIYWICQCECGNTTSTRTDGLVFGKVKSCGCIKSKGERVLIDFFFNNKISFVSQKTFSSLKDKKALRFDFYLPDFNICIEFNGEQHYRVANSGWNDKKHFKSLTLHDKMKKQFCLENNIPLIIFTYKERDKMTDEYIKKKIFEKIVSVSRPDKDELIINN